MTIIHRDYRSRLAPGQEDAQPYGLLDEWYDDEDPTWRPPAPPRTWRRAIGDFLARWMIP